MLLGKCKGKMEPRGLDYYWEVNNESAIDGEEVIIADDYNPYPRLINKLEVPFNQLLNYQNIIKMINKQFDIHAVGKQLVSCDLDGDGQVEYILYVEDEKGTSACVCLLDNK